MRKTGDGAGSTLSRRQLMTSLAGVSMAAAADEESARKSIRSGSRTLVAYFSRSGNTRVVAGLIQRALGAELFEIRPANDYPADYLQTVEQATRERDRNFEPPLATKLSDIARYATLYLGFPVWGETVPPVIRSFLKAHELTGKTVVPFITHGGYGPGNSRLVLRSHASGATLERAFTMQADQERQTMNTVNGWLEKTLAAAP
jgi:flavodoxin